MFDDGIERYRVTGRWVAPRWREIVAVNASMLRLIEAFVLFIGYSTYRGKIVTLCLRGRYARVAVLEHEHLRAFKNGGNELNETKRAILSTHCSNNHFVQLMKSDSKIVHLGNKHFLAALLTVD